jgi:ABC-type multidrug transport system ATPase subunit
MVASGLKVDNLSVHTVKGVNLELPRGHCIGLTGPSGAGKTLLLRALADLDPHDGQMWLDGVHADAIEVNLWRRQVGLLPAESAWWHDCVGDHFTTIDETSLTALGFGREVLAWQVAKLSSGERQRLALLRLLIHRPKVLLLDEPTTNLDAVNTRRTETLLRRYRQDRQAAVLWVSHDMGQLERNCRAIYTISAGRLMTAVDDISIPGSEAT